VLLLTGFLATILMRVLKADFIKYTRDDEAGGFCILTSAVPASCNGWGESRRGGGVVNWQVTKHFSPHKILAV